MKCIVPSTDILMLWLGFTNENLEEKSLPHLVQAFRWFEWHFFSTSVTWANPVTYGGSVFS